MLEPYRGLRHAGHGGDISGFNSHVAFHSRGGPVRLTFALGPDGVPARAVLSLMGLREFSLTRLP